MHGRRRRRTASAVTIVARGTPPALPVTTSAAGAFTRAVAGAGAARPARTDPLGPAPSCAAVAVAATVVVAVVVILVVVTAAEPARHLVAGARQCAFRLLRSATLGQVADQLWQPLGVGRGLQVEPVGRLGETEVGVDARDDDARVDRQQLDTDEGDADVRVDDEAFVEDKLEDVGETAGS